MTDRTVVYRLRADAQQFSAQMKAAGASVADAANKMTAANKEGVKFRQGLDTLGGTAGKIGLVAAAGLGAAVAKAANFDQAMSSVQAATRESASAMESLRQAALDAGADTAFSATEAAAGIENLAKAGVATQDILDGGLAGALDLAAAGGLEVADAAEAAAGAMAQFGLEGEQVPHIADLLAAAAGKAQGEVSDFVFALKQGGTVAAQTGLSLEETTGALAAMAEQSLLGSDAGTSFKTMLAALTPNSNKAAQAMEQYNIHAFDAQGNFVGMTELAGQLQDGLAGLTDEQRAMALETIFGSDAVRAASIIYDNGAEGIANWTAQVNDAGFAAETAETKLDNLKGDLEELGGALETALIGTGDGSQGMLRGLTQNLTGAVNAYNKLPESAQNAAGALLATSAAVGGSIWVGAKLVGGIANTREALENLGLSGPKATKAMKGVAGAAAGLAVLAVATSAIKSLQEATDESLPGLESLEGRLISMAELPEGFTGTIGAEFDSLADSIDRIIDPGRMTGWSDAIGGLTGFDSKSLREARAEIDALDQAFASLVTSGNADVAAEALANLAEQYGLSEAQVEGLIDSMPQYGEALAGQENDAKLAAAAQSDLESSTRGAGDAMSTAAEQAEDFGDTLDRLNEKLAGRANMRDYEAAIDDFTKSLKDNGKTFDINTEKGRNNQAALDNIASSALEVAENMGKAQRQKFLTNAIEDIRTMGKNMGLPKSEIKALIELLRTANNTDVKPNVDVDAGAAMTAIERVRAALAGIKDKSVTVRVTQTGAALTPGFGPQANAAGGFITGPGGPTDDAIPSYLSNGEYVIKAAAVQKYGVHMFDRLNAMHFAEGGKVERRPVRGGVSFYAEDNTKALQRAIDRLTMVAQDQTAAVEDQTRRTDEWAQRMESVAKATVSGFDTGLFERDSDVWAAGAGGGWLSNLSRDISGLQERGALQSQLAGLGLSGDALAALLGQGSNADISSLIASGQVSQYASLFNQRAALQGSVGAAAGQQAYGAQFAAADRQTRVLESALRQTNLELTGVRGDLARLERAVERGARESGAEVGRVINGAASNGQRDKKNRTGARRG